MQGIEVASGGHHVAIIMRTYNRPVLLVRALASVLQQTHQDWHLYLVNDGGDRAMLDPILSDYRSAFANRLSVIHHPANRGMEAASNSALQQAKGDFIVVHNDDDTWHPAFLHKTTEFLNKPENHRYAAVTTNCEVICEQLDTDHIIEKHREKWGFFKQNICFSELLYTNNTPPISFLIRKSVVDAVGLFNSDLPVLGDWDYNLRVLQIGDIGTIDEVLAYYHHRIDKNNNVYNNTVTTHIDQHQKYNVLYTNALIRAYLKSDPSALGLLRLTMLKSDDKINMLMHQHQLQFDELKALIKRNSFLGKIKYELKKFRKKYLAR